MERGESLESCLLERDTNSSCTSLLSICKCTFRPTTRSIGTSKQDALSQLILPFYWRKEMRCWRLHLVWFSLLIFDNKKMKENRSIVLYSTWLHSLFVQLQLPFFLSNSPIRSRLYSAHSLFLLDLYFDPILRPLYSSYSLLFLSISYS